MTVSHKITENPIRRYLPPPPSIATMAPAPGGPLRSPPPFLPIIVSDAGDDPSSSPRIISSWSDNNPLWYALYVDVICVGMCSMKCKYFYRMIRSLIIILLNDVNHLGSIMMLSDEYCEGSPLLEFCSHHLNKFTEDCILLCNTT